GGDFILRIEDTDSQRFVPGAEEYILKAFHWLGIRFDEGVGIGGKYGPYRQSERKDIYIRYVNQLLESGHAYYAFDTPEELEAKRGEIANFQYDASTRMRMRNSLTLPQEETARLLGSGVKHVVRFKIEPDEEVCVDDLIRGEVTVNSSVLDDKVLYKSADQLPTYHLANIVDDHLMEITHVIRGEEWLPSAPLHVLLYRAFGWEDTMPQFAHLPLLLKPEGNGKLSKRDGDRLGFPVFPLEWKDPKTGEISSGYRESGYLPEAVVNFLALLGWNPGGDREIFSINEMASRFDLSHCSKNGAKFDYEKGTWFNHQYMMKLPNKKIQKLVKKDKTYTDSRGVKRLKFFHSPVAKNRKVELISGMTQERVSFTKDIESEIEVFFTNEINYDEKLVKALRKEDPSAKLKELQDILSETKKWKASTLKRQVSEWITGKDYNVGNVMKSLRLALTGKAKGPDIYFIMEILGKKETFRRIRRAIDELK
ncbi:MAG: glutamate--tRNA ligase, partial [Tannerellaceae bacterium]|nr:glutamate--tRNA ligase [Tannerellaceae bacterium]